ncbi:class I SAM-dependent methyltransferase [Spirulina sp. CCNP1310]|uniref:class I SAM-dependent methyltransferase n=1 Tax=Spirulina sp. CCNP1310 TaxID=3110249 RepID=UPI002B22062A|nr:class I SAM-dependent methyltransferase [Spirulina sp. CCNP1310]MEA5418093.1 class I SAM-dependent methyltransferase [Spirulina sp. CCNP1310]
MLLPEQRTKLDPTNDSLFYDYPRFVTHVDDHFIAQLTTLYRDRLTPQTRILDLMSSWVSHLPEEMAFAHVEGHGMNGEELAKNPRLDHYFVQNLNENTTLPFEDESFAAVLNCVSVQYLQYPDQVFAEVARILTPGGLLIISFSNRMFYQKAIAAWREGTESSRVQLVQRYIRAIPAFEEPEVICKTSPAPPILQLLGMGIHDPFYAVIARKQKSPSG